MKQLIFAVLLFSSFAAAQGVRYDIPPILSPRGTPLANVQVSLCSGTATITGSTCNTPTQSFTDITLVTQCSVGSPVTLANSSTCQGTSDGAGNAGFWLSPGAYIYCLNGPQISGQCYNLTVPAGVTSAGTPTVPALTVSGVVTAGNTNGVVDAASQAGATHDIKLNACITAAKAQSPHICDARNLGNGTIAAQVNVGDNATATPVTLLLPTKATWTSTITDGTSCAIKVFDKGNMLGDIAGQGMDMIISNAATGNVDSLVCTDPSPIGGGSYVHIGGFRVDNSLGGTVATAALNIQQTFDNALVERVTATCQGCVGVYVHNLCCNLVMRGIQSDGASVAGSKPCIVGVTGSNTRGVHFADALNCVHPGTGNNALLVRGDTTWTENIAFDSIYIEPNQTDLATALMQISAGGPVTIGHIHASNFAAGGNYLIDIASASGNGQGFFLGAASVPTGGNAINDHVHGTTVTGTLNQTVGPYGWGNVGSQFFLTGLTLKNNADAAVNLPIDSGLTAAAVTGIVFRDRGVDKGTIFRDASNNFIYNTIAGVSHFFEVNGAVIGRMTANGTTLNVGITQGSGLKHQRVAGCATAAAANATCDTTLTWTSAFADANYTVTCSGDVVTSGVPMLEGLNISAAKQAASITIRTLAQTSAAAQFTTIDCIAMHD